MGRRLRELFHHAGLTGCRQRTWTFDRQAPLEPSEREFFARHLRDLVKLTRPHLDTEIALDVERLTCPDSEECMLDSPHFAATSINYIIWGMK